MTDQQRQDGLVYVAIVMTGVSSKSVWVSRVKFRAGKSKALGPLSS